MKFTYKIIEDTVTDDADRKYITYGIELIDNSGIPIKTIPNIFLDKDAAEYTVKLFNDATLSPEHFYDAVDDAIVKIYSI